MMNISRKGTVMDDTWNGIFSLILIIGAFFSLINQMMVFVMVVDAMIALIYNTNRMLKRKNKYEKQ